jgi:TolA-binding protein
MAATGVLSRPWLLAATALLAAGCSSLASPGDRYFEAGDYVPAAAAYEVILEGRETLDAEEQRSLYRLGLSYTFPQSPRRDPERAAEIFERLIGDYPDSPWARQARLILELAGGSERLQRALEEARTEIEGLTAELSLGESDREMMDAEVVELEAAVAQLRSRVRRLEAELEQRELELEQLKKIDLE